MSEWDEKIARATSRPPRTETITLHDQDAVEAALAAQAEWQRIRGDTIMEIQRQSPDLDIDDLSTQADASEAVQEADTASQAARTAAVDAQLEIDVVALAPERYDELQYENPPNEEQAKRGMSYDPHGFIPALLAESSIRPMTVDQARKLTRTAGDRAFIFEALRRLNQESSTFDLGKGLTPTPS